MVRRSHNQVDGFGFIEKAHQVGSSWIRERWGHLPASRRNTIRRLAIKTLGDVRLRKQQKLRDGAIRVIVALLPDTFPVLEQLLHDQASPQWYETQFTAFCSLDRADLCLNDQERVLELIRDYLLNISSGAGYAAWKAGDLLGDEWRDSETVKMLEELLFSARYVPGRKAALHGIEHALKKATPTERRRLFGLVRRASEQDRSAEVRRVARLTLDGVGCGAPVRGRRRQISD